MINKNIQKNKGYTLLFAVLVSSIVLSVGISILTISKKEFLLSSSVRDSITAFYTADSGLECALHLNDNLDTFSTSTGNSISIEKGCMDRDLVITRAKDSGVETYRFDFEIPMQNNSNSCSRINVVKSFRPDGTYGYLSTTTITSKGYNLGWIEASKTCSEGGPRRVERAIEYSF